MKQISEDQQQKPQIPQKKVRKERIYYLNTCSHPNQQNEDQKRGFLQHNHGMLFSECWDLFFDELFLNTTGKVHRFDLKNSGKKGQQSPTKKSAVSKTVDMKKFLTHPTMRFALLFFEEVENFETLPIDWIKFIEQ